jgi:hypothetical protein
VSEAFPAAVDALRSAGAALAEVGSWAAGLDPGGRVCGADGAGALGELGRGLHGQLVRAVEARAAEAVEHATRMQDAADTLAAVADAYAATDDTAHRRHREAAP